MELYLIRHTRPEIDSGICYGRSDIDVTATFASEASTVQRKLAAQKPDVVYTSPSLRCRKLAALLAMGWTCEFIEDVRLMELHFGEWEMRSWQEIDTQALERWGARYIHESPPGGETFMDLYLRVQSFLTEMPSSAASAALVTHAGVIRALLATATGKTLNQMFDFELDYGGVTHLKCQEDKLQLVSLNI